MGNMRRLTCTALGSEDCILASMLAFQPYVRQFPVWNARIPDRFPISDFEQGTKIATSLNGR